MVICYTEEFGKLTAIAKSALKPSSIQAMHLDTFNLVEFDLINGRVTPIIAGAQAEQSYPNLKNNLTNLAMAYFFIETANRLFFDYQKDKELWNFFVALLEEFNNERNRSLEFFRTKQIEFLNLLGYAPNLSECAFCSAQMSGSIVAYSIEAKGAVCQSCFLNGSRGIVTKNGDLFTRPIMGAIFESLVEHKLYSLNFLNSVLR